tara:strand:+ start:176 stop:319 length:144 start_codon:yes stop_codon:yes gene_type:complete
MGRFPGGDLLAKIATLNFLIIKEGVNDLSRRDKIIKNQLYKFFSRLK